MWGGTEDIEGQAQLDSCSLVYQQNIQTNDFFFNFDQKSEISPENVESDIGTPL